MPSLDQHHSSALVKLIYIGDSGTGKTGSLVSLLEAGYKLRILDMDNGLDTLVQYARKQCPDKLKNVEYETIRDRYKIGRGGTSIPGGPKALVQANELLDKWPDGSNPSEWGPDTILVLDSLSAYSKAAFAWAKGLNPTAKDPRQWYASAQGAVEDTLAALTSESFHANVIIISHVNIQELPDGSVKGYTNAVGKAMGPIIPRYFNTLILAESTGSGINVKRKIKTVPTGVIDLKTSAPFKLDKELPLESGLATVFEKLKETK